ncbi:hypothetical protein [Dactylosporangium sp. CA-139066]|uniref:hypothetical protein n=1 Tax=Dactylosporangium sp. CA-139066 TaxID=3239930 RepID=UPI003D8A53B3
MRPTDSRIQPGAALYYAAGDPWRVVPPKRATVIDAGPYRIVRRRQGAFYVVSWHRDDAGTAVLVHVGGEPGPRAVPARDLRGLWLETLAATGRTIAGVKAHEAAVSELATSGRPITGDGLLQLAARDDGLGDDTFAILAQAVEDRLDACG